MFIRKKRNKSGSVSVQIVQKVGRKNQLVQSIGCSSDDKEIEALYQEAQMLLPSLQKQSTFAFLSQKDEEILNFVEQLNNANVTTPVRQLNPNNPFSV